MFKVIGSNIYHTRGDTARLNVDITDKDGKEITGYTAMFSVKKKLKDVEYLFQLEVKNGAIDITHEMTRDLPFGDYVYDIEVHTAEGEVQTIGPAEYHLTADVTK